MFQLHHPSEWDGGSFLGQEPNDGSFDNNQMRLNLPFKPLFMNSNSKSEPREWDELLAVLDPALLSSPAFQSDTSSSSFFESQTSNDGTSNPTEQDNKKQSSPFDLGVSSDLPLIGNADHGVGTFSAPKGTNNGFHNQSRSLPAQASRASKSTILNNWHTSMRRHWKQHGRATSTGNSEINVNSQASYNTEKQPNVVLENVSTSEASTGFPERLHRNEVALTLPSENEVKGTNSNAHVAQNILRQQTQPHHADGQVPSILGTPFSFSSNPDPSDGNTDMRSWGTSLGSSLDSQVGNPSFAPSSCTSPELDTASDVEMIQDLNFQLDGLSSTEDTPSFSNAIPTKRQASKDNSDYENSSHGYSKIIRIPGANHPPRSRVSSTSAHYKHGSSERNRIPSTWLSISEESEHVSNKDISSNGFSAPTSSADNGLNNQFSSLSTRSICDNKSSILNNWHTSMKRHWKQQGEPTSTGSLEANKNKQTVCNNEQPYYTDLKVPSMSQVSADTFGTSCNDSLSHLLSGNQTKNNNDISHVDQSFLQPPLNISDEHKRVSSISDTPFSFSSTTDRSDDSTDMRSWGTPLGSSLDSQIDNPSFAPSSCASPELDAASDVEMIQDLNFQLDGLSSTEDTSSLPNTTSAKRRASKGRSKPVILPRESNKQACMPKSRWAKPDLKRSSDLVNVLSRIPTSFPEDVEPSYSITTNIVLKSRASYEGDKLIHYPEASDKCRHLIEQKSEPPLHDMATGEVLEHPPDIGNGWYTPKWTRYEGAHKEGWCGLCEKGSWYSMKRSQYMYHLQYEHGISSNTHQPYLKPTKLLIWNDCNNTTEGLCHKCDKWIPICFGPVRKISFMAWFKHAHKCHRGAP